MHRNDPAKLQHNKSWQQQLADLLKANNRGSAARNGRRVGTSTQTLRRSHLLIAFRNLKRPLGMFPEQLTNFKEKHVRALAEHWESRGLAPSTIQNRISSLRTFMRWINKPGVIREATKYVKNPASVKRSYVAPTDRSWSAKGINAQQLIEQVMVTDKYVGNQLRAIAAFGLRVREGIMLKPHRADKNVYLSVNDGTKGGRDRIVPILTPAQRELLEELKKFVGARVNASLANPNLTLNQATHRFYYVLGKHGITRKILGATAHGLRHQYANDRFEEEAGVPSPVRGGDIKLIPRLKVDVARAKVSEELGHTRTGITTAYYGSMRGRRRPPDDGQPGKADSPDDPPENNI
jgi:integrase